jgi:hypothetical protein
MRPQVNSASNCPQAKISDSDSHQGGLGCGMSSSPIPPGPRNDQEHLAQVRGYPLFLLSLGRPQSCAGWSALLPPHFCGVELRQQDEAGEPIRVLAPVCSQFCQELLIHDEVSVGRLDSVAWQPEKLRAALDDIENFDGVIDLSIENLERIIVEALSQLADGEIEHEV